MSNTISVTRALSEVKALNARIEKAIGGLDPVCVGLASPQTEGVKEAQETFKKKAIADYQSVQDMITRRNRLKREIIRSNAVTEVTIGGATMTVAEAIDMKSAIKLKEALLTALKYEFRSATSKLEEKRAEFQRRLDTFIEGQEKILKEPSMLRQASVSFAELHEPKLLDPIGVEEQIARLTEEVETFLTEVDFTLSEANARTMIEV